MTKQIERSRTRIPANNKANPSKIGLNDYITNLFRPQRTMTSRTEQQRKQRRRRRRKEILPTNPIATDKMTQMRRYIRADPTWGKQNSWRVHLEHTKCTNNLRFAMSSTIQISRAPGETISKQRKTSNRSKQNGLPFWRQQVEPTSNDFNGNYHHNANLVSSERTATP